MKILIIDGAHPEDLMAGTIRKAILNTIGKQANEVKIYTARDIDIQPCKGCFMCWTKTPGTCIIDDDNRLLASEMMSCDHMVLLTPITFGGYSSHLKIIIDHFIQNTSPYFTKVQGETHHKKRYDHYPGLTVIGWQKEPDCLEAGVFRKLVYRNSLNLNSIFVNCEVFYLAQSLQEITERIAETFNGNHIKIRNTNIPDFNLVDNQDGGGDIGRAVLLVGSPRANRSTSFVLGTYLIDKLKASGVITETFFIYRIPEKSFEWEEMLKSTDNADLVILSFPLYIDTLPSKVIYLMEEWRKARLQRDRSVASHFTAVVNCGFPEKVHCNNVISVSRLFSREIGAIWSNAVAVTGGRGLGKKPLEDWGNNTRNLIRGLDLAADSLLKGQVISSKSIKLMAKLKQPPWLYRLKGNRFWKKLEAKNKN